MSENKVVYLLSQFPTANHTYLLREVIGLRELGWRVKVVSVRRPDRPIESLLEDERAEASSTTYVIRASHVDMVLRGLMACAVQPMMTLRGIRAAVRHARNAAELLTFLWYLLECAVICRECIDSDEHVHGHFCSQLLVLLDAMRGGNWSATVHGPAEFDGSRSALLPTLVSRAVFIRTISSYGRAQCLYRSPGTLPEKVFVNRLGVSEPWIAQAPSVVPLQDPSAVRIVTVGRLSFEKGQQFLLDAFARVAEVFSEARLAFVGDGPDRDELQSRVTAMGLSGQVEFLGWQSPSAVRAVLRRSDVFISSSFAEGIPVVLMEAMASGVPCIATPVGGVTDLIEHGVSGLLVQPADVAGLVDAIMLLTLDPPMRQRIAGEAKLRIRSRFRLSANVAALSEELETRLGRA